MQSWLSETRKIPSLQAEICFQIEDSFYYGPDRVSDISERERLVEKLTPPRIESAVASLVRTSEALGQEQELAAYYGQIVRMARHHKRPFNAIRQYFWLRLWLWNTEHEVHVSFPWYDSFSEIDRYLKALVESGSGLVDHDVDQGWELETYAEGDSLHFRQRDPDADETRLAISVPRDELLHQVSELRQRTRLIISRLSEALGTDVWTSHVHSEPAFKIKPR
jgi:hypothetical protein